MGAFNLVASRPNVVPGVDRFGLLTSASSCIDYLPNPLPDVITDSLVISPNGVDVEGQPRQIGSSSDCGADEF